MNTPTPFQVLYPCFLQDFAVIQRGIPIPLRGKATPRSRIILEFQGQIQTTTVDDSGHWSILWGPLFATQTPFSLTIRSSKGEQLQFKELLVGEVWVCSGQSNMEFPLKNAHDAKTAIATADLPSLRALKVPMRVTETPSASLEQGAWKISSPDTAGDFSAIGFYFGRILNQTLKIPVGLIMASVGETPGETWLPRECLEGDSDFAPIFERWHKSLALYPDPGKTTEKAFKEWDRITDQSEREGRPIPSAHPKLIGPGHKWTPGGLYNGMIAPLTSFPIRGVIWFQGAGAPERAMQYRKLFRLLIRSWRKAWNLGDFPFYFIQEAAFGPRRNEPCEHSWAELREAQAMALAEPHTAMAVAIDTGGEGDIHPAVKAPLGDRLARAARALVYGEAIPYSGPVFQSMIREGNTLRLHFSHTYGGLATSDGKPVRGFAVSGGCTDFSVGHRGFKWAKATIEGDSIIVESELVPNPIAVRYGWAQNPDLNLINSTGLPASPFRSDQWPGVTYNVR